MTQFATALYTRSHWRFGLMLARDGVSIEIGRRWFWIAWPI